MKRPALILLLILTASFLGAFDWPVPDTGILSTFGTKKGGKFAIGLSLSGNNKSVYAIEDGEIIFSVDSGSPGSKLPSGLGDLVVIRHDDGLKSIYSHLEEGSVQPHEDTDYLVRRGTSIGRVGDTGWSYGRQLGFAVLDSEFNQFVNPLLLLPSVMDSAKPVIGDVWLQKGDIIIPLEDGQAVAPDTYTLAAEIFDPSEYTNGFTPMAPFSVTLFLNGSEIIRYSFEALQESDNGIILQKSGGLGSDELYTGGRGMNLGSYDFISGNLSIEIIVSDYGGNETGFLRDIVISGG